MTCGGISSNRTFGSELYLLDFHNFSYAFCRHGVTLNNRKAAGLGGFQSPVLCELQVKHVNCIKIWSVRMFVGTILGTPVVTSLTSGNELSNGCIDEKKYVCLPLQSLVLLPSAVLEQA